MQTPEEVAAMLRLKALGWSVRRIAGELGCSHMTVRRYLAAGGWVAYRGRGRPGVGKMHLAVAIGRQAILAGYTALFVQAPTLVAQLAKARSGPARQSPHPLWANRSC
jgi:hypothetical protein